jgi:signal transduction histidine kinase
MSKRNVDRLGRLINDVLDYQKMQAGRMEFTFEEHSINEIVRETRALMLPMAKQHDVRLTFDLKSRLPKTLLDRDKVIQVLMNLMSNAIKFTKDDGHVVVTTEYRSNRVHVSVSDNGIGIAQNEMPNLFRSFEQIGGNNRKVGGTGLGLVICKEIIVRHKGDIWAESVPGEGTTFHFDLPVRRLAPHNDGGSLSELKDFNSDGESYDI